jgi:hypothetical protein
MRVRVDNAGRHPPAAGIDHLRVGRRLDGGAHRRHLAVAQQQRTVLDDRACRR